MTRVRLLVALLTALLGSSVGLPVVHADAYTYDGERLARVEVDVATTTGSTLPQVNGSSVRWGERSSIALVTSTTPSLRSVATEAADPITGPVTPAEAKALAEAMGYVKTNFRSHGQPVYKLGKSYISRDVDGHCGGVWKEASSPEDLASKTTRNGTYNADLTERLGD
jgi:hypothetical protein